MYQISNITGTADEEGHRGILLQKNVVAAAGKALEANMRAIAPLVLPLPELVLFPDQNVL